MTKSELATKPIIEFIDVTKTFASVHGVICALDKINLTIEAGEIFGVIGRSGAGKSSLLRCINLLEKPTSGKVLVNGQNLQQFNETELHLARRNIGMIFQQFNLLSGKTVWDNIAMPLKIAHFPAEKIKERVTELLQLVGLSERANHYPSQLSGGQKQRVAIARALATEPKILLCDEATSALDPQSTNSILQLLREINKKLGITIVLITHEIDVIKTACERVALLEHGRLVQLKQVMEFFSQPLDVDLPHQTEIASYIGDTNWDKRLLSICENESATGLLLRIRFHGHAACQPLIAHLVKNFNLEVNILQANLEFIGEHLVGTMIVQVSTHDQVDAGLAFLRSKGVMVEELAYVS